MLQHKFSSITLLSEWKRKRKMTSSEIKYDENPTCNMAILTLLQISTMENIALCLHLSVQYLKSVLCLGSQSLCFFKFSDSLFIYLGKVSKEQRKLVSALKLLIGPSSEAIVKDYCFFQ